jgi:hypothetical protein
MFHLIVYNVFITHALPLPVQLHSLLSLIFI